MMRALQERTRAKKSEGGVRCGGSLGGVGRGRVRGIRVSVGVGYVLGPGLLIGL